MTTSSISHREVRPDFTAYVEARRPALLAIARRITGDLHSAEDLLQSTLTQVYLNWEQIRDHRVADAYVRRGMVNQHHSWWRSGWRRHENAVADPSSVGADSAAGERGLAWDERAELWQMVQDLPPQQRAAVVLRYYEELSEAETARVLGLSVGTVKSNTSRGLAALRRRVAGDRLSAA